MTGDNIFRKAIELKDEMVKDRRYLHNNPGVGFDIEETFQYVKNKLEELGYSPLVCGRKGLVATVGKKGGKVFLIRADMDGLKISEDAKVEFKSTNGNMHACGHDMHTAMLLGAARLLKEYENEINGTVKLMFQPAEELLEGAKDMIEAGVLESPNVDAGLMIHVITAMPFKIGDVIVANAGVSAPSADYFTINIQGKGSHGANPHLGIDPINIAAHIVIALQEINARELGMKDSLVLTLGQLISGDSNNAIPDTACIKGNFRTCDEDVRKKVKVRIGEIAKGISESFRGSCQVDFTSGAPTLINDANLVDMVKDELGQTRSINVIDVSGQINSSGSEDFAYISHKVNTVMIAVAAGDKEKGYEYNLHHPKVKFDEDALPIGCYVYAYVAMKWLENN